MDFCLLKKNMGKHLGRKYGQKPLDNAKKSTTDAIKTASKKTVEEIADLTDLSGKKNCS